MYCNKCGNVLADGAMFCSFCGAKNLLAQEQPAEVAVPVSAEAPVIAAVEEAQPQQPAAEVQAAYTTEQQEMPRMAPNFGSAPAPVKQKKPKTEKYYTFGHLLLCLISTGIMAIVAGVFVGLYFSVV